MEITAPNSQPSVEKGYNLLFKFVLIGHTAVGKSCFLTQFMDHKFNENYQQTIGVQFGSKIINIVQFKIKLQIWDTAGLQSFRSITRSYYRGTCGVIVIYDITNRESFEKAKILFQEYKKGSTNANSQAYFIGNKLDLVQNRKVSRQQGQEFAFKNGMLFAQISNKNQQSVNQIFYNLADAVTKHNDLINPSQDSGIKLV